MVLSQNRFQMNFFLFIHLFQYFFLFTETTITDDCNETTRRERLLHLIEVYYSLSSSSLEEYSFFFFFFHFFLPLSLPFSTYFTCSSQCLPSSVQRVLRCLTQSAIAPAVVRTHTALARTPCKDTRAHTHTHTHTHTALARTPCKDTRVDTHTHTHTALARTPCKDTRVDTHSLHSCVHSHTRTYIHSLIHPFSHSLVHSFIHSLTLSAQRGWEVLITISGDVITVVHVRTQVGAGKEPFSFIWKLIFVFILFYFIHFISFHFF